jgi:hypothetical protein
MLSSLIRAADLNTKKNSEMELKKS